MYLIKTRQVTHVFALSAAFIIVFAICCGNLLTDKVKDAIDDLNFMFKPSATSNYYQTTYPDFAGKSLR